MPNAFLRPHRGRWARWLGCSALVLPAVALGVHHLASPVPPKPVVVAPMARGQVSDGWAYTAVPAGSSTVAGRSSLRIQSATPVLIPASAAHPALKAVTAPSRPSASRTRLGAPASAPLPPGAVARISMAAIGLDLPVYRGSQSTIDLGVATLFDDGPGGWSAPVALGGRGTVWIAAHHTSHGAPFRLVDRMAVGDRISVRDANGAVYTYQVVDRRIVGTAVTPGAIYGDDPSAHRLVVQTSMGASHRLLLTASLILAG